MDIESVLVEESLDLGQLGLATFNSTWTCIFMAQKDLGVESVESIPLFSWAFDVSKSS